MNPLNYFPKSINTKDYQYSHLDSSTRDAKKAYLSLTVVDNQFKLAYVTYCPYEGGITAYLPFTEEDIYDSAGDEASFFGALNGGFIGDNIDVLVEQMGKWLVDNHLM